MKFQVSSIALANKLSVMAKVINAKPVLPILSNFLLELDGETLQITVSDGECMQCSTLSVTVAEENGKICLPADKLLDALRSLPEQSIEFTINEPTFEINIKYNNGKYDFVGYPADEYTIPSPLSNIKKEIQIEATTLNTAITQSLFAVANDELRPIMNGIHISTKKGMFQSAASDGQKLVRNTYKMENPIEEIEFVVPTKAAKLLKNLTNKVTTSIIVTYNEREAIFIIENDIFRCRLLEGKFPNYNAVIPKNNTNIAIIEREILLSTIKRVGVFSSVANGSIEMNFSGIGLDISGKDIDYSISAKETLFCAYSGKNLRIGFKCEYLRQILENITSKEITFLMDDCSQAAIIKPVGEDDKTENLSLLVPMMLGA